MNLKFVIPNGSLSAKLRNYLAIAGYPVGEPDRTGFCGKVERIYFYQLDRRMVPHFINTSLFQAGITGLDLLIASGLEKKLTCFAELSFSRATNRPTRWVLVCRNGFDWRPFKRHPARIACELPGLAKRLLKNVNLPFKYKIEKIEGSEEQCVFSGLAEFAVIVTETGGSIEANNLEIFPDCEQLLVSTPRVIARKDLDLEQEENLLALTCALQSVVAAEAYVMVVFDFPSEVELSRLGLPADVSPTISPLLKSGWKAGQICVQRSKIGMVTANLSRVGAKSIDIIGLQGHF